MNKRSVEFLIQDEEIMNYAKLNYASLTPALTESGRSRRAAINTLEIFGITFIDWPLHVPNQPVTFPDRSHSTVCYEQITFQIFG